MKRSIKLSVFLEKRGALVADALLLIYIFLILFPFLWTILTSIKPPNEIITLTPQFLPSKFTWEHYVTAFTVLPFLIYLRNSFITATVASVLSLAISTCAAYSVSRFRFKGRSIVMLLFLTLNMFPVVLLLIPLYVTFLRMRLLDTYFSMIIAYATNAIPFSCWMLTGYFNSIPNELEEAGMVDGCTHGGAFIRITLPLAVTAMAATLIYVFIYAWNEFLFAVTFTQSISVRTLPVGLSTLIGQYTLNWGLLSAGGVISSVPVVILFLFVQKSMVAGMTAGAVKG